MSWGWIAVIAVIWVLIGIFGILIFRINPRDDDPS